MYFCPLSFSSIVLLYFLGFSYHLHVVVVVVVIVVVFYIIVIFLFCYYCFFIKKIVLFIFSF